MSNSDIQKSFEKVKNALQQLKDAVEAPLDEHRFVADSVIQRFEFTYELFWKLLRQVLEEQGIKAPYPKIVFQEAYAGGLIDDEEIWLDMLKDRNLMSHVYHRELADEIYEHIKTRYYFTLYKTFEKLSKQFNV